MRASAVRAIVPARRCRATAPREVFHGHVRDKTFADPLALVQYLDYKTYLPGDILTKVDRASMAHSLEVRTPFLDYEFVEWASQPAERRQAQGQRGQARAEATRSSRCCRAKCCTGTRWGSPCRSTRGSAARCANTSPIWCAARGSPSRASSIRRCSARIVDDHQSGRRDYSAVALGAADVRRLPAQADIRNSRAGAATRATRGRRRVTGCACES